APTPHSASSSGASERTSSSILRSTVFTSSPSSWPRLPSRRSTSISARCSTSSLARARNRAAAVISRARVLPARRERRYGGAAPVPRQDARPAGAVAAPPRNRERTRTARAPPPRQQLLAALAPPDPAHAARPPAPIQPDRHLRRLVRVGPNRNRPLHALASLS